MGKGKLNKKKCGLTLIELLITVVMLAALVGVSVFVFRVILLGWISQETRAGIGIDINSSIEKMARNLRGSKEISFLYDNEIRFSKHRRDEQNKIIINEYDDYIYYFYNENDVYPANFNQDLYGVRKAVLNNVVDRDLTTGTFTYGDGQIIVNDVLPSSATDLSVSGGIADIELSVKRGDETIRLRTEVKARNL